MDAIVYGSIIYHTIPPGGMWDAVPVLYWRCRINGKMTWQKAKAAQVQQGLYAIEPPVPKVIESETVTEGESDE